MEYFDVIAKAAQKNARYCRRTTNYLPELPNMNKVVARAAKESLDMTVRGSTQRLGDHMNALNGCSVLTAKMANLTEAQWGDFSEYWETKAKVKLSKGLSDTRLRPAVLHYLTEWQASV